LAVTQQGAGYRLQASSTGLGTVVSDAFGMDGVGTVVVKKITPNVGTLAGGGWVTITGTGLATVNDVTFGPFDADLSDALIAANGTSIRLHVPEADTAGLVHVLVTTDDGTNDPGLPASQYVYGPAVTAIAPISGPSSGGTLIKITGQGLQGVTGV